jgi:phosphonate ABC transporter permease subunit PhnE
MVVTPPCGDAGAEVQVEGFNFSPSTQGPLNFVPPSGVKLQVGQIQTDSEGYFLLAIKLPKRGPVEEAQSLQAITRQNVGWPRLSQNGKDTWEKIVETVFLALLATSLGTVLAIPVSFLAARNIMKEVKSPLSSIWLSILGWPAGFLAGMAAGRWLGDLSLLISQNSIFNMLGLALSPFIFLGLVRWAIPQEEITIPSRGMKIARLVALLAAALVFIHGLYLLAILAFRLGIFAARPLGPFGFMGTFFASLGDILDSILVLVVALVTGALFGGWAGRLGQVITERTPSSTLTTVNVFLAAVSGATLFAILGGIIEWLYQLNDPLLTFYIPALVGAGCAIAIVFRTPSQEAAPIGLAIYYVVRTILNALRSIEAFIMAIIFVVLVSTGPFAGVLALSLHTIAALAKLYSEQVESILPGPLEAIKATGATRLQTIIYAVIPQIVPPYISFTMYRWDINVRMSTIIGFAGGGGIGLLLQQNINLLNYRAASAQMLAITVVVALMDYISSALRERVV